MDTSVLREERLQRTETSPLAPAPTCPLLEGPAGSDGTYTKPPGRPRGAALLLSQVPTASDPFFVTPPHSRSTDKEMRLTEGDLPEGDLPEGTQLMPPAPRVLLSVSYLERPAGRSLQQEER